jgi:hypothetical protein
MVFASIGKAGSDLQVGYWSGSAWTNTANLDTAAALPTAGTKFVATGWLINGATTRSVIAYYNSGATNIGWVVGNGGSFTIQTDFTPTPSFGSQSQYNIQMDPFNKDRLMFTVSDANSDIFAKRLVMNSTGAFTWTNADGGAALELNTGSSTRKSFDFAYARTSPAFNWIDIAQPGNQIALNGDDSGQSGIPIGFNFNFFGNIYSSIGVSTNGFLSFGASLIESTSPLVIPSATDPNDVIAPLLDDLFVDANAGHNGKIYVATQGSSPNRKFIVEYYSVEICCTNPCPPCSDGIKGPNTFEVILSEADRSVTFQYLALGTDNQDRGGNAAIGIENSTGTVGYQYSSHTVSVGNVTVVRIESSGNIFCEGHCGP